MVRALAVTLVVTGLLTLSAGAQSTTTTATSLADSTPQENVSGGSVALRAPGTWIQDALSRHAMLMAKRVNGPRFGNSTDPNTQTNESASSSGSGSSASAGSLTDLISSLGGTGTVGSLIGSLSGGSTTTSGSDSSGTDSALAELLALAAQYGGTQQTKNAGTTQATSIKSSTARSSTREFGGALGRLPKAEQLYQSSTTTTDTTDSSFRIRWSNAMLQTFFTALGIGLQTSQFVTVLKDALRPLVYPTETESTDASNTDTTDNTSGDTNNTDTDTDTTGNGIEDLSPTGDTSGGDSTI